MRWDNIRMRESVARLQDNNAHLGGVIELRDTFINPNFNIFQHQHIFYFFPFAFVCRSDIFIYLFITDRNPDLGWMWILGLILESQVRNVCFAGRARLVTRLAAVWEGDSDKAVIMLWYDRWSSALLVPPLGNHGQPDTGFISAQDRRAWSRATSDYTSVVATEYTIICSPVPLHTRENACLSL